MHRSNVEMNSKEGGAFRPALLTLELENVYE